MPKPSQSREPEPARLRRALTDWFSQTARTLPWRTRPAGSRPLYPVLVSELMLQQTQVSRVAEAYPRFIRRFPTIQALAHADESEVLAAWTGLGYYRRARLLQAAARTIVDDHQGTPPADLASIRALPGVGEYTAGAIASLCFDMAVPAVDGNVRRVFQRIFAHDADPAAAATLNWARHQAQSLHDRNAGPRAGHGGAGILNESLIELGALVCTPRAPKCDHCPIRGCCLARAQDLSSTIPRPKPSPKRKPIYCASVIVHDARGRVLIEQRPGTGLWGSLFQVPTLERTDRPANPREVRAFLAIAAMSEISRFDFQTTHRNLSFIVYEATRSPGVRLATGGRRWVRPDQFADLGLSSPQRRILLGPAKLGVLA